MFIRRLLIAIVLTSPLPLAAQTNVPPGQAAGGVQAGELKFRTVRSVSGTKGKEQAGHYVVEDPRTMFYVPDDRQVIVHFEWEGPTGPHHFEGLWKNPEGKVVVLSGFQYEAHYKRFGGYWSLALTETTPTGFWALEARIDGEIVSTHNFQILAAPRPAGTIPTRRMLMPSEIYERALAATLSIERLTAGGEKFGVSSGFLVGDGVILTAFQAIDGAHNLRLVLPDGRRLETDKVLGWNRRQDWAMLKVDTGAMSKLDRAQPKSWAVGDRCFFLDVASEGNRVITDVDITGKNEFPGAGERLNLSYAPSAGAIGSPLLNEYGEAVGVVGGSLVPGASSFEMPRFGATIVSAGVSATVIRGMAVPLRLIPMPAADVQPTPLTELAAKGQFVPPLVAKQHVAYGTLTRQMDRKANPMWLGEDKEEFSRKDSKLTVMVEWDPKKKIKATVHIQLYDIDNRLLTPAAPTKPLKVNLRPGERSATSWDMAFTSMAPGIYRMDVLLNSEPAWRKFFRIVE